MRNAFMILALALATTFTAHAGELDNEKSVTNQQVQLAKDLPATLVMRVNTQTGEVQALHSKVQLAGTSAAVQALANAAFTAVDVHAKVPGELDRDSSSSSWYFCFPNYNWFQPSYFYGGFNYGYSPYFNYGFGNYNYYFYRWNYWF